MQYGNEIVRELNIDPYILLGSSTHATGSTTYLDYPDKFELPSQNEFNEMNIKSQISENDFILHKNYYKIEFVNQNDLYLYLEQHPNLKYVLSHIADRIKKDLANQKYRILIELYHDRINHCKDIFFRVIVKDQSFDIYEYTDDLYVEVFDELVKENADIAITGRYDKSVI